MSSKIEVSESIAQMVTEWVETGIKMGTDWRNGLSGIIEKRLVRFAAPVVDRQPVDERAEFEGVVGTADLSRLSTGEYQNGYVQSTWEGWQVRANFSAPSELAELQATIDKLTAENERLTMDLETINADRDAEKGMKAKARDQRDRVTAEIERLKGGQGEPVAIGAWRKTLNRFHFISRDIDYMRKNYSDCADFALIELSGDVAELEATYVPAPKPAPVVLPHSYEERMTEMFYRDSVLEALDAAGVSYTVPPVDKGILS